MELKLFPVIIAVMYCSVWSVSAQTKQAPQLFGTSQPTPAARLRSVAIATIPSSAIIDTLRAKPWVDSLRITQVALDFRALLVQKSLTLNFFTGDNFVAERRYIKAGLTL